MQQQSLQLLEVQIIFDEYDFPLTLRQLYYQLVSRQIIPNRQAEYKKLSRLCTIGRDEGYLPEDMFVDRLRQIQKVSTWTDLPDFMDSVRQAYRKDYWIEQPCYLEIWSEKDALRSVFSSVTDNYTVPLLIVRGQVSRTAIYETYERYSAYTEKDCFLFYLGDFDPSGIAIYKSIVGRLNSFNGGLPITFKRIALTPSQVAAFNLPRDPAKQTDPNYKKFVEEFGDNAVELDALPPDALKELIEESILDCIDKEQWDESKAIEKQESEKLQELCM
jgi:hypothetical protein